LLAVLWIGRFGPYTCSAVAGFPIPAAPAVLGIVVTGVLLTIFLFVPAYDLVSFLTYKLGWEKSYDPIDVYEGEFRAPGRPPISQQAKLYFLYPLDLAIVVFVLLPSWTKFAYCG
jgi:hypothetical protein